MTEGPSAPARTASFDVAAIRRDFPILRREVHGRPLVYLDNASTTHKPQAVIDRLVRFYSEENANVHRGLHQLSQEATGAYEGARDVVRRFINAPLAREVVFTPVTKAAFCRSSSTACILTTSPRSSIGKASREEIDALVAGLHKVREIFG